MAKRKKNDNSIGSAPMAMPRERRVNVGIEEAENGFIIRGTCEGIGKNPGYESKTFIAPNHAAAMQIANTHMNALGKKSRGKKGGRKKIAVKKG